jgi:hypothetical protein
MQKGSGLSAADTKRAVEIYRTYTEVVSPLIITLEILDGEFPVEVLNEIRAVFGHLSKAYLNGRVEGVAERNLSKAEGHMKRAILDLYKYLCLAYDDNYREFAAQHEGVDLSDVDDGNFLPALCKKRKLAQDKLKAAKSRELDRVGDDIPIEAFAFFEEAYVAYADVDSFINDNYEKLERLRRKTTLRERKAAITFWIGVVGVALSAIGIGVTVWLGG